MKKDKRRREEGLYTATERGGANIYHLAFLCYMNTVVCKF